jgi:hypothetical protein
MAIAGQRALFWFFGVSAFSGAELCLNVTGAGAFAFVVGNDVARINQDTLAAVATASVRALVFSAAVNFDENQAGLVDAGGILPKFILPRSTNVDYDDFLVAPSLNLTVANTIQAAVDQLKSEPIDALRFSGTLAGAAGATNGYASDPGPEAGLTNLSQSPVLYPRGSVSGSAEIYVRVLSNDMLTDTNFTFYVEGAATPVTVSVPAGSGPTSVVSTPLQAPAPVAIGQGVDLEVDAAAGGAGRSITFSATLRLLP